MLFWSLIAWWWLYPLALTVLCFYLGLVLLFRRRPRVAHGSAIARLAAPPAAPQGVPHQVSPVSPGHPADATSSRWGTGRRGVPSTSELAAIVGDLPAGP